MTDNTKKFVSMEFCPYSLISKQKLKIWSQFGQYLPLSNFMPAELTGEVSVI
ncbi:MAG: hypothetical protein Ta2E_09740 [Mycoplasmoidaceae bacterium]|nr:MAG: hypothetical protein Ta2E_09740 [Mycoplasmoidaceae bacterium]